MRGKTDLIMKSYLSSLIELIYFVTSMIVLKVLTVKGFEYSVQSTLKNLRFITNAIYIGINLVVV